MRSRVTVVFLFFIALIFGQEQELSANEIISLTIKNKHKNYVKQALQTYQYNSYNKLIFSIDESLVSGQIDSIRTVENNKEKITLDSTDYYFKKEIAKQHFYISEKIAEHQYADQKEKENILAAKMAGFKEPIYEFLALGITNISFYKKRFSLLGTDYVSPLAKNSFKDYQFTLAEDRSDTYIIQFKSTNRKKSVGLEGELFIDKKSYALVKSKAKVIGRVNVFMEQNYVYLDAHNVWFPSTATIFLRKGTSKENVRAFRRLIGYDTKYESDDNRNPEDISYILISSENFNIAIDKEIHLKKSGYAVEIKEDAVQRDTEVWDQFDLHSKNRKDLNTYAFLDSLVEARKIERKLNVFRKFLDGKFATKLLDIDLSQVATFNNHEGFRLGFGGTTNDNLAENIRLNGYMAYGNKDKELKYQYGASVRLNKETNTWIGGNYTSDIFEAAKTKLLFEEPNFAIVNPRNLNISQFYSYRVTEGYIHHDLSSKLTTKIQFDAGSYRTEFDYTYISPTKLLNNYKLTNATLAFQWTPLSKYLRSPKGKFLIKKAYPKVSVEATKSFDNILDGDFDFTKFNINVEHQIKTIKSGSTEFLVRAGYVHGEAPLSHLYNVTPNHSLVNPWRARINFSGTNAFETMLFNEFISDKFVSIQARQNFEKFRIGRKFKPKLSVITRFAIGDIDNRLYHQGVNFKRMNKGYLESGVVLNQLFYGFGVSSFYRLGAYQFSKFEDNISLKITYVIDLF